VLLKNPAKKRGVVWPGAPKESEWAVYGTRTEKRSTTISRKWLSFHYV